MKQRLKLFTNKDATQAAVCFIANVGGTQIEDKGDDFLIRGIPITKDGAIMNGIRYTSENNEKGMSTLHNKNMTLSHPRIDGENVSSYEGEALIKHWAGGYVSNTYRKDGIWYADAKVNKKRLLSADNGQDYYNRLENKQPIAVSTGLFGILEGKGGEQDGQQYKGDMAEQNYDHLAMLAENERPAGGETTVMRFNGKDTETITVNISDYISDNSTGLDFTDGHMARMRQLRETIEAEIKAKLESDGSEVEHLYVEDWNDDTVIFYTEGETYAIGYDGSGDSIQLSGEPERVTMAPSYKPLSVPPENEEEDRNGSTLIDTLKRLLGVETNKKVFDNKQCKENFTKTEGMRMAHYDALAKKLNMNADEVKNLSDEELAAKLDGLGGGESQGAVNTDNLDEKITQAVAAAFAQNEQNSKKQKLVDELKANKAIKLPDSALEKLDVNELQELKDGLGDTEGLNASFTGNSAAQAPEMP